MKIKLLKVMSICMCMMLMFTCIYNAGAVEALNRLVKNNVKDGATITLPKNEPTKEGFSFGGWKIAGISGGGIQFMSPVRK